MNVVRKRVLAASAALLISPSIVSAAEPNQFPGLSLWLDAADAATIVTSGGFVEEWQDKSGYGFHATQSDIFRQPMFDPIGLNDLPTIRFDAFGAGSPDNDGLFIDPRFDYKSHIYTVYIVNEYWDASFGGRTLQGYDFNWLAGLWGTSAGRYGYYSGAWIGVSNGVAATSEVPVAVEALGGIRQSYFSLNGTPIGRGTTAASAGYPGRLVIGSVGLPPLSGTPPPFDEASRSNVSEILFYNRVLSDMERREVSNYLAEKWDLPRPFQRHYASQSVRFAGGDEGEGLDFTGNFLYALTANPFAMETIGDATFTDIMNTPGVTFNSEFHIQNWINPFYGVSEADFALANVTNSIRWTNMGNGAVDDHTTVLTGLTPGNVYKVQFIFAEGSSGRHFGIEADGSPIRRDFEEAAIAGNTWNTSPTAGTALIYQFLATNDTVTFSLVANDLNVSDRNPILNALTMEDLGKGGEGWIGAIVGVDSIDLSGTFLYALDFGNQYSAQGIGPRTVAGVTFEPAETTSGVYTYADNGRFYNQPFLGFDHPDSGVLEDILATIRYEVTGGDDEAVAVDLMGLTPGQEYKLQLMFSDSNSTNRFFDIVVNDVLVWNDFSVGSVTGGDPTMGAHFTYQFIADRTELNIVLQGTAYAADINPILSALTLEVMIPEPGTVNLMLLGLAGFLGSRRRR